MRHIATKKQYNLNAFVTIMARNFEKNSKGNVFGIAFEKKKKKLT